MGANVYGAPGRSPKSDLDKMIEQLAVQVHETWQRYRLGTGWAYGSVRDDARKETPNLVPFADLTEDERNVDRVVARGCLEGLRKLGYEIVPIEAGSKREGAEATTDRDGTTRPASSGEAGWPSQALRDQLHKASGLSLTDLQGLWQQCRSAPSCLADIHIRLGEEILKRGEPILAYDVLSSGLTALENAQTRGPEQETALQRLRQLLALALAECGAPERALLVLRELAEIEERRAAGLEAKAETRGLLGRVAKDLARNATSERVAHDWLEEALSQYCRGFDLAERTYRASHDRRAAEDAYYCGINAAAVLCLLKRRADARVVAERVLEICRDLIAGKTSTGQYWLAATLGEAELICDRPQQARAWYGTAVAEAGKNWRVLASIRRQLHALIESNGENPADWEDLFPKAAVVVFASPGWTGAETGTPQTWVAGFHKGVREWLTDRGVIAGYLCGCSLADLLLGEALLERHAEVHIVLPCAREFCRRYYASKPEWHELFEKLLGSAASVAEDPETYTSGVENVGERFAGLRAYGASRLRAARLGVELQRWGLEERGPQEGHLAVLSKLNGGFLLQHWEQQGCSWERIPVPGWDGVASDAGSVTQASGSAPRAAPRQVRAMLFADVKGFSKLEEAALFRFAQSFLPKVAEVLHPFGERILSRSTAGDGLFLVFGDIETAVEVAFRLREMMVQMVWKTVELPDLAIRISLDAGPVYTFADAVTGKPGVCGMYVNRAARIEPITPPNQVYASEAFTSLYVASGGRAFQFEYVGQTQLPKGFGLIPLYAVSRQQLRTEGPQAGASF